MDCRGGVQGRTSAPPSMVLQLRTAIRRCLEAPTYARSTGRHSSPRYIIITQGEQATLCASYVHHRENRQHSAHRMYINPRENRQHSAQHLSYPRENRQHSAHSVLPTHGRTGSTLRRVLPVPHREERDSAQSTACSSHLGERRVMRRRVWPILPWKERDVAQSAGCSSRCC